MKQITLKIAFIALFAMNNYASSLQMDTMYTSSLPCFANTNTIIKRYIPAALIGGSLSCLYRSLTSIIRPPVWQRSNELLKKNKQSFNDLKTIEQLPSHFAVDVFAWQEYSPLLQTNPPIVGRLVCLCGESGCLYRNVINTIWPHQPHEYPHCQLNILSQRSRTIAMILSYLAHPYYTDQLRDKINKHIDELRGKVKVNEWFNIRSNNCGTDNDVKAELIPSDYSIQDHYRVTLPSQCRTLCKQLIESPGKTAHVRTIINTNFPDYPYELRRAIIQEVIRLRREKTDKSSARLTVEYALAHLQLCGHNSLEYARHYFNQYHCTFATGAIGGILLCKAMST